MAAVAVMAELAAGTAYAETLRLEVTGPLFPGLAFK